MKKSATACIMITLVILSLVPHSILHAQDRIVSRDSTFTFVAPSGLHAMKVNEEAELQFADTLTQSFMIFFPESKKDLVGWNLVRHSHITLARLLTQVSDPVLTGPRQLSLSGFPAVQYTVQGTSGDVRLVYLHTTVESPEQFVQIIMWGTASTWEKAKPVMDGVVASIELLPLKPSISIDPHEIVYGTWAWERPNEAPCSDLKQQFIISDNRRSMQIHHNPPFKDDEGKEHKLTQYVIEQSSPRTLHTYIPTETRLTDDGKPVKWDLEVIGRNRLTWHRADWPAGSFTGMLRRCK